MATCFTSRVSGLTLIPTRLSARTTPYPLCFIEVPHNDVITGRRPFGAVGADVELDASLPGGRADQWGVGWLDAERCRWPGLSDCCAVAS
eukprot:3828764-Pyramimonas_sp.AAC.1